MGLSGISRGFVAVQERGLGLQAARVLVDRRFSNLERMEEEFQSPSVERHVVPSPICDTPSPSKKDISTFYAGPVPPFVLEALDQVSDTEVVDLPRHYLPDYSF